MSRSASGPHCGCLVPSIQSITSTRLVVSESTTSGAAIPSRRGAA